MKIRIFALAKELGIDSKDLIQHCNDAGLAIKASPLASVSPEERDMVLEHLKSVRAIGPDGKAAASEAPTPSREVPPERAAKARPIRTLGPLAGTLRARRGRP